MRVQFRLELYYVAFILFVVPVDWVIGPHCPVALSFSLHGLPLCEMMSSQCCWFVLLLLLLLLLFSLIIATWFQLDNSIFN